MDSIKKSFLEAQQVLADFVEDEEKLDGLAFEIVAASGTDAQGQQLNENQTLQLKNVRLKVPGGAIVDLN